MGDKNYCHSAFFVLKNNVFDSNYYSIVFSYSWQNGFPMPFSQQNFVAKPEKRKIHFFKQPVRPSS